MIRKIVSCSLVVMMLLGCFAGMAETVASPTLPEQIVPSAVTVADQDVSDVLAVILDNVEGTASETLLGEIEEKVQTTAVVDCFGTEAAQQIAEAVGEADTQKLVFAELWNVSVISSVELPDEVNAVYVFPAEYADDAVLVALIGIENGDAMQWTVIPAQVVNGQVKLTYSKDILQQINGAENAVVALLQIAG